MNLEASRWSLPEADSALEALGSEQRAALAQRWQERAHNELSTSTTFAELYRGLVALEAPPKLLRIAAYAVGDELRHAEICHAVAERYAGHSLLRAPARVTLSPRFAGCSEREARVLHVVLHACLNEGVAAAYLGTCFEQATSRVAHSALQALLKDEIHHARLGWAFLASASAGDRALVAAALPELLNEVARLWLNPPNFPTQLAPGHGCLTFAALQRVFADAIRNLLLPGFEHSHVLTGPARAALARQPWFCA